METSKLTEKLRAVAAAVAAIEKQFGKGAVMQLGADTPEQKISVRLHSGLIKLTMRGWLGVLAAGGPKVLGWMAQKGLKGPSAVASALSRLKKG